MILLKVETLQDLKDKTQGLTGKKYHCPSTGSVVLVVFHDTTNGACYQWYDPSSTLAQDDPYLADSKAGETIATI